MRKRKQKRLEDSILNKQRKYEKLRKKAYVELAVLEKYFSKRQVDQEKIYLNIKRHLESNQKEISYFGLRGILIGLITAIFVYIFNTGFLSKVLEMVNGTPFFGKLGISLGVVICTLLFLCVYFMATGQIYIDDWRRRNQIYINEYMIKIVNEKLLEIKNSKG